MRLHRIARHHDGEKIARIDDLAAEAGHRLDGSQPAEGNILGRVSALMADDKASAAQFARRAHDHLHHRPVCVAHAAHPSERIGHAGVEAAGDENEIGPEGMQRGKNDLLDGMKICAVPAAGRQGQVDVGAISLAFAALGQHADVEGVEAVLMQRDREHLRIVIEGLLGAVAVMDVPIDDGDAAVSVAGERMAGGQRDIGEEAEAARAVALGMMPRRTETSA